MAEQYNYKGKIRNVKGVYFKEAAEIGFFLTEGENEGLSIFIHYDFGSDEVKASFIGDLEKRISSAKNEGVYAEVSLSASIDRIHSHYDANGPIRFLKDK
jgi:hypothetical protein